jgi:hypothetical protein
MGGSTMTTQELAELFLTALYDLAEAAPHPNFLFNMNEFAPAVGLSDFHELADAVNLLETKGLVYLSSFDPMGGISAGITPDGSQFVEKGGETGIIAEFRKDPRRFYQDVTPAGPMAPPMEPPIMKDMGPEWMTQSAPIEEQPSSFEPAAPRPIRSGIDPAVDGLLMAVAILLEKEPTLSKTDRDDLLKDVECLKIQVQKTRLNKEIVIALLDSLATAESVIPLLRHIAQAL